MSGGAALPDAGPWSSIACAGCGWQPAGSQAYPFRCARAGRADDVDHVLVRTLDPSRVRFPTPAPDDAEQPFLRYRGLLSSYHRAITGGLGDNAYRDLVRQLDQRVAEVDGHGLRPTPLRRDEEISASLGFGEPGGVWVKDETGNVAGSHKARHLFGVLLHLEVAERTGLADPASRPSLAIASCGNAALAAAVLARAGGRALRVFVPAEADSGVLRQLAELGAEVVTCPRQPGQPGDPAYLALLRDLAAGALPFTCQGNLNGLAIEGGQTLGYELASGLSMAGLDPDHLVVQVGGGALASACIAAFGEAVSLGALPAGPRVHAVQAEGGHPLERAYWRVRALLPARRDAARMPGATGMPGVPSAPGVAAAVSAAASRRSGYMWPWESEPKSLAGGILDDETYDWRAVVAGLLGTGGQPVVASEAQIAAAHRLGRQAGYLVDPTGASGLAGLLVLRASGTIGPQDRVVVLFTGRHRAL